MAKHNTGIEWTHLPGFKGETWNPIVGCSLVSPGCTNCYAMSMADRLSKMHVPQYQGLTVPLKAGPVWTGRLNLAPESVLKKPLGWKKPRAVFVNSMGDLFHEDVPVRWIVKVFAVMALCPDHIFMVLTKRAERMQKIILHLMTEPDVRNQLGAEAVELGKSPCAGHVADTLWPLPNVWLGVSVEDQDRASERVPWLMHTPAAKRFLSCEPLLGPVNLRSIDVNGDGETDALFAERWSSQIEAWRDTDPEWKESFEDWFGRHPDEVNPDAPMYRPIDWVIVGGESGPKARLMHPDWAVGVREQCFQTDTPFFFKQWGEWCPPGPHIPVPSEKLKWVRKSDGLIGTVRDVEEIERREGDQPWTLMARVGKKKAGHVLDGETHHNWPEMPHG